ncbi:bifunctional [glutamine synthetase] adenylyltransferase/[glutamine synthetase]-adenylyl-L-tyrosine phosphorylase [Qipengyuania nanhaisediminis]|uniref:bifunctional [glutamine synthetase] adenylyltransferase/[glutamine synthetase]-adenylyl-L-tyrosine phosphorylase n=1 Tax=Qipengyuania nanhaisediminis TaxID=604088 RepID=UPI0038B2FE86
MARTEHPCWSDALDRARAHAPFLARALEKQAPLTELLAEGRIEESLEWARQRGEHEDAGIGLRRHRYALAAALGIADLAGAFDLARVMDELTRFADHALDRAIRAAIEERTGEAEATGMIALALGKQGAGELNYSSDIDPILLYDPDTLPRRAGDDAGETAQRYARRVVKLLSENTAEGYVLRVDLRLRPAAEVSPLAVPRASALAHYQGQALAWERAAFIRARAAAGDKEAGERFLADIAPFVWRTKLDFGAIEEIRELTRRIRQNHDGPQRPGPGFDLKRGRGGIREIEFYAQTHQLIHGGRDPALRVRGTRAALDALAEAGRIEAGDARVLGEGYDRLRQLEHRLQMVGDRQTHSLPPGEALDHVARLDGLADGAALVAELEELTARTGRIYEELIGEEKRAESAEPERSGLADRLGNLGFDSPSALAARIAEWRDGRYAALRSPQALEAFDALLPALLEAFADSDDPARAITRWQNIIERTQSAITVFRLLAANPALLERLVAALTLSPTLADQLARRPDRLDVLVEDETLPTAPDADGFAERMMHDLVRDDYEARLDAIRRETGEARFILGVRLIEAELEPVAIARALADLAEAAIRIAAEAAEREFAREHGHIEDGELVILGLGRLGGGVLTHASDLDMVYLFTGDFTAQSDGARPLGATLYFNRLASRVTAALSVPTAQGALYEVDTRLRPQGNQGPLAVSLEAFAKYQRESAWTWEHMALTRARTLSGSPEARARVQAIITEVLAKERDPDELRKSVLGMRTEMALHKPARGQLDVKLLRGGLVDVEFLVHFLQLRDAARLQAQAPAALDPDLHASIAGLVEAELLDRAMIDAHELMTNLLVASRLLAPDGRRPPRAAARALARACGRADFAQLTKDLAIARASVARQWTDTFNEALEIDR